MGCEIPQLIRKISVINGSAQCHKNSTFLAFMANIVENISPSGNKIVLGQIMLLYY